MPDFCGDATCNARIGVWFANPADVSVFDPCRRCLAALEEMLGLYRPRAVAPTLRDLYGEMRRLFMLPRERYWPRRPMKTSAERKGASRVRAARRRTAAEAERRRPQRRRAGDTS